MCLWLYLQESPRTRLTSMKRTYSQVLKHNASLFSWKSETQEEVEGIFPTIMRNMMKRNNKGLIMCHKWQRSLSKDARTPETWIRKYLVILPIGGLDMFNKICYTQTWPYDLLWPGNVRVTCSIPSLKVEMWLTTFSCHWQQFWKHASQ